MLTVIGNYIKWCPNKPQSKFALYHLTKCCGKRGQAEQLSINKNVRKYRRCAYVCLPSSCLRAACVCVLWMYVSVNAHVQRDIRSKSACVASPGSKVDGANIFGERTCLKYISIITVISHWHTKTQSPIQMQYCTWNWLTLVIFGMAEMVIATGWIFYVLVLATANCRTQLFCGCFVQTKCIWNITALGGPHRVVRIFDFSFAQFVL